MATLRVFSGPAHRARPPLALMGPYTMALSISLASYTVEVRALHKAEPLLLRFQEGEESASVHGTLRRVLVDLQTCRNVEKEKHLINVTRVEHDDDSIWGIVRRGEYGTEIPIYSASTLSESYRQKANEASMRPFYFRLYVPHGSRKGVLVVQRTGPHGASTDLRSALEHGFRERHEHHRIHFARAVHPELLKEMMEGKVYAYEIVTYAVPSDLSEFVKRKGPTKHIGSISVRVDAEPGKPVWENHPEWLGRVLEGKKRVAELWPKEQISSFKLSMDYKGKPRTFDITKDQDVFPSVIVTDKIEYGKDGEPDFDSIDEHGKMICIDIAQTFGARGIA